jgi:fido (protein-threonine AMPylation protein)
MRMTDLHAADDHATPLTPAEREDLIPTHTTLRSELNELEQQNIATANRWAFGRRKVVTRETFLKSLHRRMFERVWRWAGKYRTTERNLGVKPPRRLYIRAARSEILSRDIAAAMSSSACPTARNRTTK